MTGVGVGWSIMLLRLRKPLLADILSYSYTNVELTIRSTFHSPPRPRESPSPRFIHPPNMPRRIHSRNPTPNQPLHLRTRPSSPLPLYIEQNRQRSPTSDKYSRMGQRAWRRTPQVHRDMYFTISRIHFRIGRTYLQWTRKW
jgi:hypothetical protein